MFKWVIKPFDTQGAEQTEVLPSSPQSTGNTTTTSSSLDEIMLLNQ